MMNPRLIIAILAIISVLLILIIWILGRDEYMADNDELLLEDMMDRLDSLKEGIEPIEITSIEYDND